MRTETINIYKFSELSETAKKKAIEHFSDINVDYNWWDCTYEDAEIIGIKINSFEIDRGGTCKIELMYNFDDVCERIIKEHGEMCETYKTAKKYLSELEAIHKKYPTDIGISAEDEDENEVLRNEAIEDLEEEFKKEIAGDYLTLLEKEYEYLTSDEAIIETIESNKYEFEEDGTKY